VAKIKSKLAEELRGSLSQNPHQVPVTARTDKFSKVILSSSTAPGPSKTPSQETWRNRYATCVVDWNAKTPEQKEVYQEDANKRKITAFNQFMSGCLITIGPQTFGYEVAGGSGEWIGYTAPDRLGWVLRGTSYSPTYSGALDEIWAYIRMPIGEGHGYDLELGIYEENGWGINSHKFIEKEKEKNLTTSGWKRIYNFFESVTAGKNYILVATAYPHFSPVWTTQVDLAYDTVENNRYYEEPGIGWRWQDPWNKAPTGTGRNYSIYAGYSP